MKFIREILRTILLMGFADRIYRDAEGTMFLVEIERTSMRPPKQIRRIPSLAMLNQLMQEKCWANTGAVLGSFIAVILWASGLGPMQMLAIPVLWAVIKISGRSVRLVLEQCTEIAETDYRKLVLTKESALARLKYLTPIRIAALFLPIIGFAMPSSGHAIVGRDLPEVASRLTTFLAFGSLFAAGYLIVVGGRVINPDRQDFRKLA